MACRLGPHPANSQYARLVTLFALSPAPEVDIDRVLLAFNAMAHSARFVKVIPAEGHLEVAVDMALEALPVLAPASLLRDVLPFLQQTCQWLAGADAG